MGREVQVSFPETTLVPIGEVASQLGGDEAAVVRLYVGIRGDLAGGCLVVVPVGEAQRLADQLLSRQSQTASALGEEEISCLAEMGNILSAAFINALADRTGLAVAAEVPDTCMDMCLPAIDSVLARFNQPGDSLLLTRVELFAEADCPAVCSLLLFLETSSMAAMEAAFARRHARESGGAR
jgi:chemotaxis protein CheC